MQARFGFGPDVTELLPRFRYPLNQDNDIFNEQQSARR